MKIQNFRRAPNQVKHSAAWPFTAHGCDSFKTYQASYPGKFIDQPDGYEACQPGFRFYQQDSGVVVALKLD